MLLKYTDKDIKIAEKTLHPHHFTNISYFIIAISIIYNTINLKIFQVAPVVNYTIP